MAAPGETSLPPSDSTDEEDLLYGNRDDAQTFIQPAISPIATRLSSPGALATERVAVMWGLQGEALSDSADEHESLDPGQAHPEPTPKVQSGKLSNGRDGDDIASLKARAQPRSQTLGGPLPSPWHPGPKDFVFENLKERKAALSTVFNNSARQRRASSIGDSALRKLSKAFDSVNLPNFSTSSLFSTSHKHIPQADPGSGVVTPDTPRDLLDLHRTLSDDSALYHPLSTVSSFGDDDRWTHIREQVNIRMKAIKDSWDGPTFKLPNLLPDSLRPGSSPDGSSTAVNQRPKGDSPHSALDRVLETLTGDIVILGGYRGSILRSAQPPHRQLWVPVKVGLNIRKVNLEVGLDSEDEETMEEHIFASGMLQNIGPVDISKRLFKRLRECDNARQGKLRVHDYGYDWRLSPHLLSRKLVSFLEKLPSNQSDVPAERRGALVIAHSLGGLITRHAVNQRPELFSGVLYAGVPQRCINILGPVRNGDAVLLNEKVLTAQVTFSLRTTFVLLPEDGFCFVDKSTGEEYPVDFYNVDDWIEYRLSPMVSGPPLPPLQLKNGSNTFAPLRGLSGTFPLPRRSNSDPKKSQDHDHDHLHLPNPIRKTEITKDHSLAPQMTASSSTAAASNQPTSSSSSPPSPSTRPQNQPDSPAATASTARNIAYLRRTLAATKLFRSELAPNAGHQSRNLYPPISVLYGKEIPTVYAARVGGGGGEGRAAIARADAYDDLLFHSGDGVVLAREAMPPPGYDIVRGGRVSSDRGHITLLGDLAAVGRALEAVVRGRRKGIGLGEEGLLGVKRG